MARKRRQPELSVRAGDTFLLLRPHNHLYVVCPNPAIDSKHILIVNFVTYNHLDTGFPKNGPNVSTRHRMWMAVND